jgi:tetratricopeptide (TPR) repeat protein
VKRPDRHHAHPAREALERFMAGDVSSAEGRQILAHLLTDCADCRSVTGPLAPFPGPASLDASARAAEPDAAADRAAASLLARLHDRERALELEREQAPALLAELEAQTQPHRLLMVRNSGRFWTWAMAELLVDESFRHRFTEGPLTLELAELAVEVAERLNPAIYGSAVATDIKARAWAMRGNALRIRFDLRGSSRSLTRALKLLEDGTGDPLEEARVCELFAALRSNQRRVDQAVRLQERALQLYRRAGHRERLGKAMVDLGSYSSLAGDRDRAIFLVEKALDLVDAENDPHTVLAARHNLAVFLQEAGRLGEALSVLAAARPLYEQLGDRRNLLRLRWLEGRLAKELHDNQRAEDAFEEVYRGFVDDMPIAAALVALDLSLLYLETGRAKKVPAVVLGVEMVFRSHDVEREAIAAWIVLREAVARQRLHDVLIKDVAIRLERLRERGAR